MGKKVRISTKGFNFGPVEFGGVQFVDGVSVGDVSDKEIQLIGGSVSLVDAETDEDGNDVPIGPGADLVVARAQRIEHQDSLKEKEEKHLAKVSAARKASGKVKELIKNDLSGAQLQEIADQRGIEGLRVIANELGVKGREIKGLIEKILAAQEKNASKFAKEELKVAEKAVAEELDQAAAKVKAEIDLRKELEAKATEVAKAKAAAEAAAEAAYAAAKAGEKVEAEAEASSEADAEKEAQVEADEAGDE